MFGNAAASRMLLSPAAIFPASNQERGCREFLPEKNQPCLTPDSRKGVEETLQPGGCLG
jgi:hypothetical protein